MSRKFQRTIEDFCCLHCGAEITGDGYTNHCPRCLWSRHVDVQPGDRKNLCQGLMQPIGYQPGTPNRIRHQCVLCGHEGWNRTADQDDYEVLLKLGPYNREPS